MNQLRLERNAPHQKYFLADGSQVAGCSTIAKLGDSPEGLIGWAWNMGRQGKDYKKVRDTAADIGAMAHFMARCHFNSYEPDLREFERSDIDKAENAFIKFLDFWKSEGLVYETDELQLVSENYRYGGTLDLVAHDTEGKKVLLDWKTSKAVYNSHKWQLGGYEQLWNENRPYAPIQRRGIILIGRESTGTFKPHWVHDEDAQHHIKIFRAQTQLYNAIKDRH